MNRAFIMPYRAWTTVPAAAADGETGGTVPRYPADIAAADPPSLALDQDVGGNRTPIPVRRHRGVPPTPFA